MEEDTEKEDTEEEERGLLRLPETYVRVDFSGYKVWYDEPNGQLVLLRNNVYFTVPLQMGAGLSKPLNFIHAGDVQDVKFSLCKRYVAIQRGDVEIEIVDVETTTEWKLGCKSKRGNSIIRGGVVWLAGSRGKSSSLETSDTSGTIPSASLPVLTMVTRFGLEIYRLPNVSKNESTCKLLSTVKHTVQCFWHLPIHHVVVLATGTGQEIRPFQFQTNSQPTKLAKFMLETLPSQRDIVLAKLYDSIYCIHVNNNVGSMRLFRLGREETRCVRELKLFSPGSYGISILDNLLCVHNMDTKLSFVFDIRTNTDKPCLPPSKIRFGLCKRENETTNQWTSFLDNESEDRLVVEILGHAMGFELGENDDSISQFSAKVIGVSQEEKSVAHLKAGSLLQSVNGESMKGRSFDEVIRTLQSARRPLKLQFAPEEKHVLSEEEQPRGKSMELYSSTWVFLPPYWVLDAKLGQIWRLELDLYEFAHKFGMKMLQGKEDFCLGSDPRQLCGFLLRRHCVDLSTKQVLTHAERRQNRAYAKSVLLELILAQSRLGNRDLMPISMLFKSINDAYLIALRERSNAVPDHVKRHHSTSSAILSRSESKSSNKQTMASPQREKRVALLKATSFRKSSRGILQLDENKNFQESMDVFMEDFRSAERVALKDIRCYDGRAVMLQIDFLTWVFLPLVPKQSSAPESQTQFEWLASIVAEYVRSLHYHYIPIEQYIFELLAWLFIMCNQEQTLHQLLLYQIPSDSNRLAEMLLEASRRYEPLWQVSLDMLYRLGDYGLVVFALLERDALFEALTLLTRFPALLENPRKSDPQEGYSKTSNVNAKSSEEEEEEETEDAMCIQAGMLFKAALRLCREDDFQWNLKVMTALHSFFVSINPALLSPQSRCDKDGVAHLECSYLAQQVGGKDSFPVELFDDKAEIIRRSLGFS